MQYDFRPDVRQAISRARDEALAMGHDYVGTEHLLLGLVRVPGSRAVATLMQLGATPARIRGELENCVRRGRSALPMGELPYTSRAKKTLELAMASARDMRDPFIDTEHLLVGLLREEKGIAANVLTALGVTLPRVRAALAGAEVPPSEATRGPSLQIELDDTSDRSIYEQIVARVKEAAATGEITPGARLPAVRQLADALDIAPGTVARAYSELERLGVVVTDGARGTRIADPAVPRTVDLESIAGLLRPSAVAAFHMGARADDLRRALEMAMQDIFDEPDTNDADARPADP